jgi:hypothetical protein
MRTDDRVLTLLAAANPLPPELASAYTAAFDHSAGLTTALERARTTHQLPRPPRRPMTRLALALAVLALLAAGVASAFGLGFRPTIDFFAAKKGPSWEFVSFERQHKLDALLYGINTPVITLASPARQITNVRYDGRDHLLVVAPLKGGGFCSAWRGPYLSSGCLLSRTGPNATRIDVHLPGDGSGPIALYGSFFQPAGTQLEVSFQDGSTEQITVTWVSPPISAGFFLYKIPPTHRPAGHRPDALSLLDSSGRIVAHAKLGTYFTPPRRTTHEIPGFGLVPVPPAAIYAQRRRLFGVTITTFASGRPGTVRSQRIGLWTAPTANGSTCMWEGSTTSGGTFGCGFRAPSPTPLPIRPDFFEDTLCCQVGAAVARIELRFQDGDRIQLYPKQTFILAAIPLRHFQHGHRLAEELAYSASGKLLATRTIPTNRPGMYPCAKPNITIDGVTLCS